MLDEAVVTAGDIMTRNVVVVHPETSLIDAVRLMAGRRVSGMPVLDDAGNVIGMMTEGDLVRWHEGYTAKQAHWLDMLADGFALAPSFVEGIRAQQQKVKAVMSPGVTTVVEDTPAREVATLMHTKGIKRVPVLRDGKLVGIVARSDLIRALAQKLGETAAGQPDAAVGTLNEALRRAREEAGIKPRGLSKRSAPGAGQP
ncbi:MAG TPA: CBS domain-containing protein [Rhodopila sp.]|nr:CBS domain-containing protein [Rhodopila sp.]